MTDEHDYQALILKACHVQRGQTVDDLAPVIRRIQNDTLEKAAVYLEEHSVVTTRGVQHVDSYTGPSSSRNENFFAEALRRLKDPS